MTALRLIAWREYKQYITTRGFWLSMLMFPVLLGLGATVPALLENSKPVRHFVLVDQSGRFDAVIDDELERQYQRSVLFALNTYAQWAVQAEARNAGAVPDLYLNRTISDEDVSDFMARGGLANALSEITPHLRDDVPAFEPPVRQFIRVRLPESINPGADLEVIADGLEPYLTGRRLIDTQSGPKPLFAAVLVPGDVGLAGRSGTLAADDVTAIQYWSTNLADSDLRTQLSSIMDRKLRELEYAEQGIDASVISQIQRRGAAIQDFDPRKTEGDSAVSLKDQVEQIIPFGLAYVLWVAVFGVGNMLLTNVVEEKSNKIIEVLLSSVTAHELMIAKLLGILALGMTMIGFWLASSSAVLFLVPTGEGESLGSSLIELFLSTPLLPAFLFYFLFGYVIFAAIFLAVGSLCNSLSDAQAYMGPLMLILFVPAVFLGFIPRDPNGLVATIMSWVPLYTPFIMMMRVSADPPLFDVIGTAFLLVATAAFIFWLMGRLFRRSILRAGQPPRIAEIFKLLHARER